MLVVDDEEVIRGLLAIGLRGRPLDVTICGSGRAALAALFRAYRYARPYAAVVLDCAMPYVDGFAVARVMRCAEKQSEAFPRARLAFFTAYDKTVERTTLVEEVQGDAYWRKDEDVQRLPDLIEDFAYGRDRDKNPAPVA